MGTGGSAQIGDRVSFRITDVFLPDPSEVLANLTAVGVLGLSPALSRGTHIPS